MSKDLFRAVALSLVAVLGFISCGGGGGGGGGPAADTTQPSVPTGLTTTPFSTSQINLSWNASSDNIAVTGYKMYRDGALIATLATMAYNDIGRSPNMHYCYSLAAYDAAGNESVQCAQVCTTTLPTLPPAPIGVDALSGNRQVTLRWDAVPNATSYNIYFANVAGVTKLNYSTLQGGGMIAGASRPYVHTSLMNQAAYFYIVTAVNAGGESVESLQVAVQPVTAQGWSWVQPRPNGNDLKAVQFIDVNTGWAVGSAGTIIHTSDGGVTWTNQNSGTTSSLEAVHFVDALNGWAVGGGSYGPNATILHTTDGGTTWRMQASGNVPILNGVDFIDALNGWAVGYDGTILHTADSGRTWAPQVSGTTTFLSKVKFINALTGWAAGGTGWDGVVLKTIDGGLTWTSQVMGGAITGLDFKTVSMGWMVDGVQVGRILGTSNGGTTWGALPTSTTSYLIGIAFADSTTGWSVGTSGGILKTTNGGASWAPQTAGTSAHLYAIAAVNPQTAWAVGYGGVILHTTDGGTTWNQQYIRTLSDSSIIMMSFVSATTGWAVNRSTAVYSTVDSGLTWTAQPVFSTKPLAWIQFVNASTGWAVDDSALGLCSSPPCYGVYRTLDSGNTWTFRGSIATTQIQIWDVNFLDDMRGWAVGVNGVIRSTTDGGVTWVPQSSGTAGLLMSVKTVDASTVWAVGQGGLILKTTNGGANWLGQISGTAQDLRAIAAVNATTAWAVGGNSLSPPLLSTIDGGATWVSLNNTIPGWLNDVSFTNLTTGWAVGSGGLVMATTNGGVTWTQQNSGTSQDLYSVQAVDGTTGWISGGAGLLRTTTGGN